MSTTFDSILARERAAPLDLSADEFRALGHRLVDRIAEHFGSLRESRVTPGEDPATVRALLGGAAARLPRSGADAGSVLDDAAELLFEHSLFNGHPRFWGFITSSAAPIGVLAELLAAAVNANVGGWQLSPMATEIELQTVRWVAELLGYPTHCGGLLVSGGNMANMIGFWAARHAKLGPGIRSGGVPDSPPPRVYVSRETHTWIEKAADLSGLGTDAVRWIPTDAGLRIDTSALRAQIEADRRAGERPFLVVGTAGTVSTGAVDPLRELAEICRENGLWLHVDGAYGAPAAALVDAGQELGAELTDVPADMRGIGMADSVAVDPHKWLYAPLEAGCVLVRDAGVLRDTFTYHPPYYPAQDRSPEAPLMFYEYGPQNSRGFRALKVWLALRHIGRDGYVRMIRDDVAHARALFDAVSAHPELEAFTRSLSITTFRYVPRGLDTAAPGAEDYVSDLNQAVLDRLQREGEAFITHAVLDGCYVLRACFVNFRTTAADVAALPELIALLGREIDAERRPARLRSE